MFGLGVNRLGASRSLLGDAIANLFSNGEQGVWYDPSDLTTMLQDDTSAAPAVIGQPVGTILDKSQGLKLGSELITNGDFAADSDWVKGTGWSISGGVGVANGVTSQNLRQNGVALEENKVYSVTFTIVSISQGSVLGRFGGTTTVDSVAFNAAGTYTFFLKANSTNSSFMLRGQGGFTGTVDNVLVKEVLGNHATQPTSTKRPIYARHPEGGIRNLLNYTEQFDNGAWIKGSGTTLTPNYAASPIGTQTADRLVMPATASTYMAQNIQLESGKAYTFSAYVKATAGNSSFNMYNFAAGWASYLGNSTATSEWQRFSFTTTAASSSMSHFGINNFDDSYASDILIWGAQVEVATEASNYQKRVTDIDVTESGVGEVYYLKFDGVSDGMKINNLTSPSTPITAWFGYSATNSCILRAAESTDKEIASTESYVAKKTGVLAQVDGIATLSLDFGGNTYTARNSNGGIL